MSAVAQVVNAEMYKFFRSKSWFSSLIIMLLVSAFLFLSLPSSADWKDKLEQGNTSIEQQLNMTAAQLNAESGTTNVYIKQWKENEAYLQNNIVPANDYSYGTAAGYLSSVLSLRSLGLILIVFPVIYAVSMAKEFESGTIQFLVMNPFKRTQVLIGKYISVLSSTIIFLVVTLLANAALSLLTRPFGNSFIYSFNDGQLTQQSTMLFVITNILLSLVYYLPYMTLAFVLATVFRSTTLSLSITLLIALLGTQLLGLIKEGSVMLKFLLPAVVDVTHSPSRANFAEINQYPLVQCIGIAIGYIILLLGVSLVHFQKKDIA